MLEEALIRLGIFTGYFILAGSLTVLFYNIFTVPAELLRKTLHLICVMSVLLILHLFKTWYIAVFAVLTFACIVYPILTLFEHLPVYSKFMAERKNGEVKRSMILVFLMIAVLIAIFWGWLGESWKYIIIVAVMAWGYGDAAAALIGKTYGSRYIKHRLVEGKKTLEGTLAMFCTSWLAIFITTMLFTTVHWYLCFMIALLVAPICAIVELFSLWGLDTITVPFSAAISTFILFYFLGVQ